MYLELPEFVLLHHPQGIPIAAAEHSILLYAAIAAFSNCISCRYGDIGL
jgi:hypothetical protein